MSEIVKLILYMIKRINKLVVIINAQTKMKGKELAKLEERLLKIELWVN